MLLSDSDICDQLILQPGQHFRLLNYDLEILAYLQYLTDVHYFKVKIHDGDTSQIGLLRVGSSSSGLIRELRLRENFYQVSMIAKLIAQEQRETIQINPVNSSDQQSSSSSITPNPDNPILDTVLQSNLEIPQQTESENISEIIDTPECPQLETPTEPVSEISETFTSEPDSYFLEEEEYSTLISLDKPIFLLSEFPEKNQTLETWLKTEHSLEKNLSLVTQICQFFSHISKQKWYCVNILPQYIETGTPLKIFDLTNTYSQQEQLSPGLGITSPYCAPELATEGHAVNEGMSSYTVGALLYQLTHHQLPDSGQLINLPINPIPRLYQLLKIALSPIPQDRFPLSQFVNLLIETRNSFRIPKVHWNIASQTTLGLNPDRLQNEDNYGIRQQQLSNNESLIMGILADGMGGMSQGEVASQIAVQTLLNEPIPQPFKTPEQRNDWLFQTFQKANQTIAETVQDGGTTLSVVLALNENLIIAHVGDSRIYLIHGGEIQQLSEDHSLVAMLVASGEITPEESLTHPDRNVLIRSLGSKRELKSDYVQNLKRTLKSLSLNLEDGDILLLCSDGVWDLIPPGELQTLFTDNPSLQTAVNKTLEEVIARGATDNATLVALEYRILDTQSATF